ncbi:uncharacterized protein [Typha angustifolia]|uniref:uncharacterized protein n=1 Tax=Typha angustifolia TaxID=59011 RepID=UPI003C2CE6CC
MADDDPNDTVLSDVDDADDPSPLLLPSSSPTLSPSSSEQQQQRILSLQSELDEQRRAYSALDSRFNRLKSLAHEAIKKRDDALRDRDNSASTLASLQSESATASQMLSSGIDKVSAKVPALKNSAAAGLPKSQKYPSGLPSIAYGVIKRANDVVEDLLKQLDAASRSRDQAREQMEQRNYEIAVEVSQLEATISGLREDVAKKDAEIDRLTSSVAQMENEISKLRQFVEDCDTKFKTLEAKLEAQRPVLVEQMSYMSKAFGEMHEITKMVDLNELDQAESVDSMFMWKEMDLEGNLKTCLEGSFSVYQLAQVAAEKVREGMEERSKEVKDLNEKVAALLAEKQHIGTLLRSALSSKTNDVLQLAQEGLREAGINLGLDGPNKHDSEDGHENEVYNLAGAVESTVKESQLKIIELQHIVEALRAESSLLRSRLDGQAKEINQQKLHIKELEEKEQIANENVEGLMMDIAAAEEEIARWKAAAEQEAAAGGAVEREFVTQISALRKELDESKQSMLELESKLKFKEHTAAAAMAARDAAEKSLRLADSRSSRLRERLEELTRQLEESDSRNDSASQNSHRYMCWPWQWLGLDFVRYSQADIQQNSNEMELSEPLV